MRFIRKGPEPRELRIWKKRNAATPQNLRYGGGDFPAEAVRRALLREQFHLCAYTMKRLKTAALCQDGDTRHACHIEHVRPQSRRVRGEDIDYRNMVACHPPSRARTACGYGAQYKGGFDPTEGDFVSPLSPDAETHFGFDRAGNIHGLTPAGRATVETLNHVTLRDERAAAIDGALTPKGRPISARAARRLAQQVLAPDKRYCLPAYCVAIAIVALAFAGKEERKADRLRKKSSSRE